MTVPLLVPRVDWNHLFHYRCQPPALTLHHLLSLMVGWRGGGWVWQWPLVPLLHFASGVPAGVSSGRAEGR